MPQRSSVRTEPDMYRQFGGNIRAKRKLKNWHLADLEEASGVESSHLSRIERGLAAPVLHEIVAISEALQVTFYALLDTPNEGAEKEKPQARPRKEEGRFKSNAEIRAEQAIEDLLDTEDRETRNAS